MIAPTFGPRTGWHRKPPLAMQGSQADIDGRRSAAWPCLVYRMREQGERVPAAYVMSNVDPTAGVIVCEEYTLDRWSATLYDPTITNALLYLADVQLLREGNGFRVYQGRERDGGGRPKFKQTWFCAPDAARGRKQLELMAAQESWRSTE